MEATKTESIDLRVSNIEKMKLDFIKYEHGLKSSSAALRLIINNVYDIMIKNNG